MRFCARPKNAGLILVSIKAYGCTCVLHVLGAPGGEPLLLLMPPRLVSGECQCLSPRLGNLVGACGELWVIHMLECVSLCRSCRNKQSSLITHLVCRQCHRALLGLVELGWQCRRCAPAWKVDCKTLEYGHRMILQEQFCQELPVSTPNIRLNRLFCQ